MKNLSLFAFCMLVSTYSAQSQLQVVNTLTPTQLVQNVLVGSGITVSNVTYSGATLAIGSFTTGTNPTNIGFSSGVLLTSGSVFLAPGPNNTGSAGAANGTGSDPQLAALIPGYTVYDKCVLEFDFVPLSDTLKFRYVFASEEWPEFSGSSYNDVFGFFLSGINPMGGMYANKNLAIIPNSNIPVAINNINNGTANGGPCVNCQYYVSNNGGATIQYDAFTTTLTAWALVFPCLTYHIKLAVGDAGDQIYDSGVFLEANSFMSNSVNVTTTYSSPNVDTAAVEGCNDAILTFSVPTASPNPRTIYYGITGSATNGVDYLTIPSQVTIPANQNSVTLTISPIMDSITEPTEYVILIINTSPCTYDTVWIPIKNNTFLQTYLPTDTVICADTLHLEVLASGGLTPYSYSWSTGDTTSAIDIYTSGSVWYKVETSDVCGQVVLDSIFVTISAPVISIIGDTICLGDLATVSASASGVSNWIWSNGATSSNILVSPSITSSYTVIATDSAGCKDTASAEVFVNPLPFITISPDTGICAGDTISLQAAGGIDYRWSNGSTGDIIPVFPSYTTQYTVTVTDGNACSDMASVSITAVPKPTPEITAIADTICRGNSITLNGTGGSDYIWNTESWMPSIVVSPVNSTTYTLTVTNSAGPTSCHAEAFFNLAVKRCNTFFVPNTFTPNGDGLNDHFGPAGVFSNIDYYTIYVYDRWGKLIYMSEDINNPWDGTDGKRNPANPGAYIYHMIIKETYADPMELQGTVILHR